MLRRTLLGLLMFASVSAVADYVDAVQLDASDPVTAYFRTSTRALRLDDATTLLIASARSGEPYATSAAIVKSGERMQELTAASLLPSEFVMDSTAGKIFSGALLQNGSRLALAIGWTNRSGRNINGIALLRRQGSIWKAVNAIVVRDSVRDITEAPDGGIIAVTVDGKSDDRAEVALTWFAPDGSVRGQLRRGSAATAEAHSQALATRLQRLSGGRIGEARLDTGTMTIIAAAAAGSCESTATRREDQFFMYPRYQATQCGQLRVVRLGSVSAAPAEMKNKHFSQIVAANFNEDGSFTAVRRAIEEGAPRIFISRYGTREGMNTSTVNASWNSVTFVGNSVAAAQMTSDAAFLVRVPMP